MLVFFFDHLAEQAMFFFQVFLEGLFDDVDVTSYIGVACLCRMVVALDVGKEHPDDIGMFLPQIRGGRKAFAADGTSTWHVGFIFWKQKTLGSYLYSTFPGTLLTSNDNS